MKNHFSIIVSVCLFALFVTSCNTPKTTTLPAQPTAKDSLLVQINNDYVPTSIVGEGGRIAKTEKAKRDYAKNLDRAEKLSQIEGIRVRQIPREGDSLCDFVAEMGDILFAYDSFELTDDAMTILDQLVDVIKDIPETKIEITGHTDSNGTDEYNLNLSKLRAMAVGNHLRANGIDNITESGKGKKNPIASNNTEAGRKRNRRVEIKMTTEEQQ